MKPTENQWRNVWLFVIALFLFGNGFILTLVVDALKDILSALAMINHR